jgi:hypothetical protein
VKARARYAARSSALSPFGQPRRKTRLPARLMRSPPAALAAHPDRVPANGRRSIFKRGWEKEFIFIMSRGDTRGAVGGNPVTREIESSRSIPG